MRKVLLDLDSLDVQSFETTRPLRAPRGTVEAHDSDLTAGGYEDTCGQSCTCFHVCHTNEASCPACQLSDLGTCPLPCNDTRDPAVCK
jgi:hypothetical protein